MGFTSATAGPQSSVVYFSGSPTTTKYSAGSRSWRTNNPGLLGLGVLTAQHGAIGQVLGVAVFQNPQQGRNALIAALGDENYAGLTVPQALARLIPLYTPPPRETDATGEPLPWTEPETGVDLELTMNAVGGSDRKALADLIERRLQYVPGLITQEPLDTGTLNQAGRASDSPGNLLINGRSAVHAGSGGTLSTIDICETPSGHGCKTRVYTNIAKSTDAARTACLTKVNGNPACTEESIFSKSSGDEAGRCGGVRSGTIKAKAEVVTSATNVRIEGKGALRQFDLMVSNNQNTPPAPLMQGGGARPDFLDTVGAEEKEPSPPPWRHDWRIGAGATRQLNGRWALQQEQAQTDTNALNGALVTVGTTTVATQAPEITLALGELAKQLLSGFAIKTTAAGAAAAATGAVLMLVPRQAGGDIKHYEVSEDLRIAHRSDEIYGQYERKIDGEWQDTGVQVASIHDTQNNVTGFSGLTEEEVARLESPNSYPVANRIDPSSSYPANEPIDASPGGYQPYDGDRGQILDNPMPDPGEMATPNIGYPADSGWKPAQVMMSEGRISGLGQGLSGKGWNFNPDRDIDLRGQNSTWLTGIDAAFKRIEDLSGATRDQFVPVKRAYTHDGKSVVVEWEGPKGASVNLDIPELQNGEHGLPKGPAQPHIGWKAPGKLENGRGHVFVDGDLPASRTRIDIPDLEF